MRVIDLNIYELRRVVRRNKLLAPGQGSPTKDECLALLSKAGVTEVQDEQAKAPETPFEGVPGGAQTARTALESLLKGAEFGESLANRLGDLENAFGASKARVEAAIDSAARELEKKLGVARRVEYVPAPDKAPKDLGAQHEAFPTLLKTLAAGLHAFIVGPAGSGKTYGAETAAKALDLPFYPQSFGPQTTATALFGYQDANGNYVRTIFREAFEHGGVYLLDEGDRASSHVITGLNAALANGFCSFPDGVIKRHASFRCVLAGNTWGNGATREYVGAQQLDASTLSRFVFIAWGYDEALERSIVPDTAWVKRVQAIRASVLALGVRMIVCPRTSAHGARLIAAGFTREEAEDMTIWRGADSATRAKVLGGVK
jgi:cobaltochelatase CobS